MARYMLWSDRLCRSRVRWRAQPQPRLRCYTPFDTAAPTRSNNPILQNAGISTLFKNSHLASVSCPSSARVRIQFTPCGRRPLLRCDPDARSASACSGWLYTQHGPVPDTVILTNVLRSSRRGGRKAYRSIVVVTLSAPFLFLRTGSLDHI